MMVLGNRKVRLMKDGNERSGCSSNESRDWLEAQYQYTGVKALFGDLRHQPYTKHNHCCNHNHNHNRGRAPVAHGNHHHQKFSSTSGADVNRTESTGGSSLDPGAGSCRLVGNGIERSRKESEMECDIGRAEMDDESAGEGRPKSSKPLLLRQVLICLLYYFLLALFCVLGALATQAFELPNEISSRHSEEKLETDVYDYILSHTTWTNDSEELANFTALFYSYQDALKHRVKCGYDSNQTLWSFLNSVFYTATIVTTIGYGHLAPKTDGGRIAMIVIAVFGIPLFLLNVTQVGRLFVDLLRLAKRKLRENSGDQDEPDDDDVLQVPFYLSVVVITVFVLLISALLLATEEWDFLEAVYFTFGTLATIGLGDVMPMNVGLLIGFSIFLIIGLSLVTTFLELTEAKMLQILIKLKRKTRVAVNYGLQYRKGRHSPLDEWSKIAEMISRIDLPVAKGSPATKSDNDADAEVELKSKEEAERSSSESPAVGNQDKSDGIQNGLGGSETVKIGAWSENHRSEELHSIHECVDEENAV